MRRAPHDLDGFLNDLAHGARPGDKLPTVRELMQRFGASQMVVQRAIEQLKSRGLVDAQVGRGTFFRLPGAAAPSVDPSGATARREAPAAAGVRSILLLRRSISIERGRMLIEGLQRRFAAAGHRVLEVAYTDPAHALAVLHGLPRFDACVVQSTYRTIPIDLLAALRAKCAVLAVDGMSLIGTDVEAVGTEWGEPLADAVAALQALGHNRIAFATTSRPFLATQLGLRRLEHLRATAPQLTLQAIGLPQRPDEGYTEHLVQTIADAASGSGALPFTALVAWGVEDGARFRALLAERGIAIPAKLSVVLLGRVDLANEHAGFFEVAGCSVADQVNALGQAIEARWADPTVSYGVRFTPLRRRAGESIAAPAPAGATAAPRPGLSPRRRSAPPSRAR